MDELGAQQIQVHTAASLAELRFMCSCVCTHTHTHTHTHNASGLLRCENQMGAHAPT